MASQATVPPVPNASNTLPTRNGSSVLSNAKPQFKASSGSKAGLENNRRQSGSPVDGPQRRNSTQKAWGQGTNPITQRASGFAQSNGVASMPKGNTRPMAAPAKETNTPDKHADDRLIFLLTTFIGRTANITTSNGDKFEGIFSGSSIGLGEAAYTLKMAKQVRSGPAQQANGVPGERPLYVGTGQEHVMSFEVKDVLDLGVDGVSFGDAPSKPANGVSSGFRTDADISGNLAIRERNLQRWEPSADTNVDLSLESESTGTWDQFEANARMYGVQTSYDEDLYTTSIDRSNPQYRQRLARAEKIAREIEGGSASNSHVAEERGQVIGDDSGMDEEEKYSGVHRGSQPGSGLQSGQPNKYTPPARRPPTGQPTVAGAPVDPAIISSQLARPGLKALRSPQGQGASSANAAQAVTPAATEKQAAQASTSAHAATAVGPSSSGHSKLAPSVKGLPDSTQRQSISITAAGPTGSTPPNPKVQGGSATATVENDVRDAFKQFANVEKMRVENRRRNVRQHDKDFKLNDLMKWSKGFKLNTPVPKDLVGILAKDKAKQEEIMEKAQREADRAKEEPAQVVAKPAAPAAAEVKPPRPAAVGRYEGAQIPPQGPIDRQTLPRGRTGYPPQGPFNTSAHMRPLQPQNFPMMSGRQGPNLSTRLANNQQQAKSGAPPAAVPSPAPIYEGRAPPTGPAAIKTDLGGPHKFNGAPTPPSATSTKFNVKAMEFKPNPAVSSFTPTGKNASASPSPRSTNNARPVSRAATPSGFFGAKKPLPPSARPSIGNFFNPLTRLREVAEANKEDWSSNGGIRPAHKTQPRWDVTGENKEKTYTEMFDKAPFSTQSFSPPHPAHANPQLPHQHQLPFHLQNGGAGIPPNMPPHQAHHQVHQPQQQQQPPHHPHMGPPQHHFDEHRMHVSSSASSVLPSPRLGNVNMAYHHSPMNQHANLAYGQQMPQYGMGPGGPPGPQFRQYPGGHQFAPQPSGPMSAPMMAHGHSNGPFMGGMPQNLAPSYNHQMQMYSPGQSHAFPHQGGGAPPPPGPSGYPSPSRGAPMMMHQGSQQGHPPQPMMMYGMSPGQHHQPMYAPQQSGPVSMRGGGQQGGHPSQYGTSPHQPQHYPQQHRGGPNGHYGQPSHPPPPSGGPPPHAVQSHMNGPEGGDDSK